MWKRYRFLTTNTRSQHRTRYVSFELRSNECATSSAGAPACDRGRSRGGSAGIHITALSSYRVTAFCGSSTMGVTRISRDRTGSKTPASAGQNGSEGPARPHLHARLGHKNEVIHGCHVHHEMHTHLFAASLSRPCRRTRANFDPVLRCPAMLFLWALLTSSPGGSRSGGLPRKGLGPPPRKSLSKSIRSADHCPHSPRPAKLSVRKTNPGHASRRLIPVPTRATASLGTVP
jgi:hypothetical protein